MTAFNRNFGGSSGGSGGNHNNGGGGGIAIVGADIFAAEVDLISDALALAGVAGLAGINCNGVGSFGHEILFPVVWWP